MPICKKCGNRFANRVKIDGIWRVINRRRYCLDCSPFGKHNTKRLNMPISEMKKKEQRHLWQKKLRYYRKRAMVNLLGGKCEICQYEKCLDSLHFHHIVPSDKKMNLDRSSFTNTDRFVLLEEVGKTALICSNCHGEIHNGMHLEITKRWEGDYEKRKLNFSQKIKNDINNVLGFKIINVVVRKCKYCQGDFETKYYEQKYCSHKCCEIDTRKVINRPSKEEMMRLINNMSWVAIGEKYGVSDNTIRKWARQYGLIT